MALVPIQILVRSSTLMSGLAFFTLFGIGSQFPEYRLLVSHLEWIFWNVPTHGNALPFLIIESTS